MTDGVFILRQVNGVNVERERYSRVADMIRASGGTLDLLVVDDSSDHVFHQQNIALSKDQPFVDVVICPDEIATNANGLYATYQSGTCRLCAE